MPPSSSAALQSLSTFNTGRKSAQDINTESQAQYGIPESSARLSTLRGLVGNLQSSVNAVDPSVTGRTAGSFVTEGQRQALVNKERTPILGQLGEENTALGNEQQNFNTSSGLASQLASSVLSQDQTKYQSLLDQYNASVASEQAAEQKRQFEATLAEQKRQADQSARAASGGGGYDLSTLLGTGANKSLGDPVAKASQANADWAYQSVQNFLSKGSAAAESDYLATLDSANRGNIRDKLKVQLYNQKGIGVKNPTIAQGVNSGGLSAFGYSPNNSGLTFLR